jgi:Aminoglycoside-2''-adenylyltransferase
MKVQVPAETNVVPLHPKEILSLLGDAPFQWWIAGGWAIDFFLGKQTRRHFDTDVAIARNSQLITQSHLRDWEFYSTKREKNGNIVLRKWKTADFLERDYPGVWARKSGETIWRFEFLFHEINNQTWTFRYDESVKHPLAKIGRVPPDNIPYLLPEIALLYKAARLRNVDEQDFQRVLPSLNQIQRRQLLLDLKNFQPNHPWIAILV